MRQAPPGRAGRIAGRSCADGPGAIAARTLIDPARRKRILSRAAVEEALARVPRRRGARGLRALLAERGHDRFTRSPPERALSREAARA